MILYRHLISQAWLIVKEHKTLWFFGFLATFWGTGGIYEIIFSGLKLTVNKDFYLINLWRDVAGTGISLTATLTYLIQNPLNTLSIILILFVLGLVALFFFWIFTCSQITVIKQAMTDGKIHPLATFAQSRYYFWPALLVNLLSKISIFAILLFLSYAIIKPLVNFVDISWWLLLLYILVFLASIASILIVSFIALFTIIYLVVKDYRLGEALKSTWNLFVANWLIFLEVAAILFAVALIVGAILLSLIIVLLGILYLVTIASSLLSSPLLYVVVLLLIIIIVFVIGLVANAGLATFQLVTWVKLFTELEKGKISSKLHRLANDKLGI